jgi:hypothetical protein
MFTVFLWKSKYKCDGQFYMLYILYCSITTNEKEQNAQMIYFFSICSTDMFRSCLTIIRVRCYRVSNTVICAFVQGVIVYKYILHNSNIRVVC